MALKVGELFVNLSARTGGFFKDLENASKAVEKFSKEVAKVSATLGAMGGAAIAVAAQIDGPTKRAVDEVKRATGSLSVEVSRMLLPALRELGSSVREVASWLAGLSPELRAQVSHWAVVAVQVGLAAKVLGQIAGVAKAAFAGLGALATAVSAIGIGPILALAAALGAVVVVTGVLHRAWTQNWGEIQQRTAAVVDALKEAFGGLAEWIGVAFKNAMAFAERWVLSLLDTVDFVQGLVGKKLVNTDGLREGFKGLFADLRSGAFVKSAVDGAKAFGSEVVSFAQEGAEVFASSLRPMFDQLKAVLGVRGTPASSGAAPKKPTGALADWYSTEFPKMLKHRQELDRMGRGSRLSQVQAAGQFTRADTGLAAEQESAIAKRRAEAMAQDVVVLEQTSRAFSGAGDSLLGAMGSFGAIVNSVRQGMAEGGVLGAILRPVTDLLTQTEAFSKLLGTINGAVGLLLDVVSSAVLPLTEAVGGVIAVLVKSIEPMFTALGRAFGAVGSIFQQLMPILMAVGSIFAALAPWFDIVGGAFAMLAEVMKPFTWIIFQVVRAIALAVMGIYRGLLEVWNGLVNGVATVVDKVVEVVTLGLEKKGGQFIRNLAVSTAQLDSQIQHLATSTYEDLQQEAADTAEAARRRQDADHAAADAAQSVAESLLNVPQAFKVALARYQAADAMAGAAVAGNVGNRSDAAYGPPISATGVGVMNVGYVIVQTNDPDRMGKAIEAGIRGRNFRQTGNPMAGPRP